MVRQKVQLSDDMYLHLINEVKKKGSIWNPHSEYFNDRFHVLTAWKEIAKACDLPEDIVKSKWKNLRDLFKREVKKYNIKTLEEYSGRWRHFKHMWFLNRSGDSVSELPVNDDDDNGENHQHENIIDLEATTPEYLIKLEQPETDSSVEEEIDPLSHKRRRYDDEVYDMMYLKSLAPYFRQLDPVRKLVVRSKIDEILSNEIAAQMAGTSKTSRVSNNNNEIEVVNVAGPSQLCTSVLDEIEIDNDDVPSKLSPSALVAIDVDSDDVELEVENDAGPSQLSSSALDGHDNVFDRAMEDWMNALHTPDSDDEDIPVDNVNDTPHATTKPRSATDQLADDTGLSTADLAIVQQEELASDRHIQHLVPSTDYYDFNWSENSQIFKGTREVFTGTPGPTFPITDSTRMVDIFYKMFDDDFLDMMVNETNRYADKLVSTVKQNPSKKYTRLLRWTPTDRNEMIAFLALVILQGLYPKIKEDNYFSWDGFGTTPYMSRIMSYNRYRLLKTFHHFVDNDTTRDMTKLRKIRPVIDYFNEKFSSLYQPAQEITIDESLLQWLGRLSFAQKIVSKAASRGVKTYELCESSTGYLWKFLVCTGKDEPNTTTKLDNEFDSGCEVHPSSATAKIVYDLVTPLLHKGHTLIMDNVYNSPLLARCLKRDGQTDVYGTLRLSRKFVPEALKTIKKKDMRQGEVLVSFCSDLAVMLWRDSNLISMISTYHPFGIGTKETSDHRVFSKPAIVLDYNKSLAGVDRKDQFLASHPLERNRNRVWYKKLFRRLYNVALFNCYVIFTSGRSKINHRTFRTVLAEDLLKIHRQIDLTQEPRLLQRRTTAVSSTTATVTTTKSCRRPYVESNHFPISTNSRSTRCWMCTRNKKPSRTSFKCEECQVNLCIIGCFKAYHKPSA